MARAHRGEFKIDVDPAWKVETCDALAREGRIAILDFKGRGDERLARSLAERFPGAILEDPPGAIGGGRISRDASLVDLSAVEAALERGDILNVKAPRMGGPLSVLEALELASMDLAGARARIGSSGQETSAAPGARLPPLRPARPAPASRTPVATPVAPSRARDVAAWAWVRLDRPGFGDAGDDDEAGEEPSHRRKSEAAGQTTPSTTECSVDPEPGSTCRPRLVFACRVRPKSAPRVEVTPLYRRFRNGDFGRGVRSPEREAQLELPMVSAKEGFHFGN